jgi:hypothetical protein
VIKPIYVEEDKRVDNFQKWSKRAITHWAMKYK